MSILRFLKKFDFTPFLISPKGEKIVTNAFPPSLSRSFSEAKVGEGWVGCSKITNLNYY